LEEQKKEGKQLYQKEIEAVREEVKEKDKEILRL